MKTRNCVLSLLAALGASFVSSTSAAPTITVQPQPLTVTEGLDATMKVTALGSGLVYQWYQDGDLVTNGTNAVLVLTNVIPPQGGAYTVIITNITGAVTSNPAQLMVLARPPLMDLSGNLVGHYTFDGQFNDASANGFHGTAVGKPGFGLGKVGAGALRFTSAKDGSSFNYVTLGNAPIPSIAESDFTISFWVNYSGAAGDPPFISNKDWDSGNNTGMVIADSGNGVMKHNIRAASGSRLDGNLGPTADGAWHHVVAVYQRHGTSSNAVLYLDGYPLLSNDMANVIGGIDSGLPLNIGQDGRGIYTDGSKVGITNALMDDVAIWSRVLPRNEVEFVYLEGRDGRSFDGVAGFAPVVLVPPQGTNVPYLGTIVLSVLAGGSPPLAYQWYHDVDILPDQTNATCVIPIADLSAPGPYHVEISNPFTFGNPVISPDAYVDVIVTVPPPQITGQPASVVTNRALDVQFNVVASSEFLHYQWRHEGTNLPAGTNATLFLPTVNLPDAGAYTVVVTNFGGSVTSEVATLTVTSGGPLSVLSQWTFQNADLSAACGLALEYYDAGVQADTSFGTTATFGIPPIGGQAAPVMKFTPSVAKWAGYKMYHGAPPNGGGAYVNQYTLIYDLLYPVSSDLSYRSLLQTSTTDANDGDFFINDANGIGISGNYQGNVTPNAWHRVALAVDLMVPIVTKYIDGVRVADQVLSAGVDGRWSLDTFALLFADEDGETAPGYVSCVQFRNGKMTDAEVAALGLPTAAKIPGCQPPVTLSVSTLGGSVLIHHSGAIEEADDVAGPYTEVVGAPDPYVISPPLPAKKFYRPKK